MTTPSSSQSKWASVGGDTYDATSTRIPPRSSTSRLLDRPSRTTKLPSPSPQVRSGSTSGRGERPGAVPGPASPKEKRLSRQTSPQHASSKSSSSRLEVAANSSGSNAFQPMPFARTAAAASRKQMSQALKYSGSRDQFVKKRTAQTADDHRLRHLDGRAAKDEAAEPMTQAEEIAQSSLAQTAFKDALKHGKVRPRTLKLMFVGQGRAGKTSTLKALTGQGFNRNEESTHGLTTAMPLVRTDGNANTLNVHSSLVSGWQVVNQPEHEIHGSELQRSCAQYIAERLRSSSATAAADNGRGGEGDATAGYTEEEDSSSEEDFDQHTSKMPVDLIVQMMEDSSGVPKEEPVMLKTWDFGGQKEYYVMHHLFLTNRGVYLVITRLDAWLREGDLDSPPGADEEEAFHPPLEALTFWLSSIHIHAPDAIIVIVGTHTDNVENCREEVSARVDEEIMRLMERVPGVERQVVLNEDAGLCFFPVDNSKREDPGILALRRCIDQVAAGALAADGAFGVELPLPWIKLREELEDSADGSSGEDGILPMTAMFVLEFSKVQKMALEVGVQEEADLVACLRYLHNFGSVVFFDEDGLRDHVVLNPQWLADAMAHVLNCPRIVQGGVAALRRLRDRGELEDDLLRKHLWKAHKFRQHHEVLLRMLYRFDLIIPMETSSASQVHVVPCLLPCAPAEMSAAEDMDDPWGSLCFDFHGLLCRLLPTLFPKLVVASSRQPDISVISSIGVFRDSFRLVWMGKELAMDLLPPDRPQVVRVRAIASHGARAGEAHGLSVGTVRDLLKLVNVTLSHNNHLTFTAGILCEHCYARGRSQSERYHVIDVNELLSERIVACRHSARVVAVPEACWAARWRLEEHRAAFQGGHSPTKLAAKEAGHSASAGCLATVELSPLQTASTESEFQESSRQSSVRDSPYCPSLQSMSRSAASCPALGSAPAQHPQPHPASTGTEPICLLYASPLWRDGQGGGEISPLDVQQEAKLLAEAVGCRVPVKVELLTASNLVRLLTIAHEGCLTLHLSLHCADNGQQLVMEDDNGGAHALSLKDLEGMLAATGGVDRIGLVFLNACCSELAGQVFVAAGAPRVICCRGAVFDATARCFTRAFYHAFCAGGKSVGQAFDIAKYEIHTVPQVGLRGEAEKYLLLPLGSLAHSATRLECSSAGTSSSSSGPAPAPSPAATCPAALPGRVEDFCGRARDLWLLMQHLGSGRRCVSVYGLAQVGKSALLAELARFVGAPGRRCEGRTIHIAMSDEDIQNDLNVDSTWVKGESGAPPRPSLLCFCRKLAAATCSPESDSDSSEADDSCSALSEARILRSRVVQALQKLEANSRKVLLIFDDLDAMLASPPVVEELRKIMTELLARTGNVLILLGSQQPAFQALGAHKVVAFRLEPLRPGDASRLFLWRVHRPLLVSDFAETAVGAARAIPQNRGHVLMQLEHHPLLRQCEGNPGLLRAAADRVLPTGGSLFDIYREIRGKLGASREGPADS